MTQFWLKTFNSSKGFTAKVSKLSHMNNYHLREEQVLQQKCRMPGMCSWCFSAYRIDRLISSFLIVITWTVLTGSLSHLQDLGDFKKALWHAQGSHGALKRLKTIEFEDHRMGIH